MQVGFKISVSIDDTAPVISISGELTAEAEEELLQKYFDIPEEKRSRVIIDFKDTRYINSAGIASLINIMTRAADREDKVEFCGLSMHLKRIIDIVGLADHVAIHDTLDAALQA